MKFIPLAALLCLSLNSCFLGRTATNEPLNPELIQSLKPGMTAGEVVGKMGAPDEVVQLGRRSAYRYTHIIEKGTGSYWIIVGFYNEDSRRDIVWCFFDENQKLTHVGSRLHSHRTGFHPIPWSNVYDKEDAAADDAKRGLKK